MKKIFSPPYITLFGDDPLNLYFITKINFKLRDQLFFYKSRFKMLSESWEFRAKNVCWSIWIYFAWLLQIQHNQVNLCESVYKLLWLLDQSRDINLWYVNQVIKPWLDVFDRKLRISLRTPSFYILIIFVYLFVSKYRMNFSFKFSKWVSLDSSLNFWKLRKNIRNGYWLWAIHFFVFGNWNLLLVNFKGNCDFW